MKTEQQIKKRSKVMLPAIKLLITTRALVEPDKVRDKLADDLIENIKEQFPKETPPSWETIIKLISKARNTESPLDRPWNLSALGDYPISAEAVAKIFELKVKGLPYLTIRTAQWISRLSSLPLSVDVLYSFSWIAAYNERLFNFAKLPRSTDNSTFETCLLQALQNSDKANWTVARWEKSLDEDPLPLLNFYPIYVPPPLDELEGTPEFERWKAGRKTSENKKIMKQIHEQVWKEARK